MNMIRFIDDLYVSEDIKNTAKIKRKLKIGSGSLSIYVIAINNGNNQLEYFHNALLRQKALHYHNLTVVGLANSESDCLHIIERIMQDTLDETGGYDMKSYLIGRIYSR